MTDLQQSAAASKELQADSQAQLEQHQAESQAEREKQHLDTEAELEQLQALLASTTRELEELQFDPDPAKPFLGMAVSQKVNGTVPDNLRDLAVNLGVFQGMPGHTVFRGDGNGH